jgi:Zn-dependent M28 family amino/carboxypeptidase
MFSCGDSGKKSKTSKKEIPIVKKIIIPTFNADSAYAYIEKQLSFGPRVPESKAHELCANYFEAKLKTFTPHVIRQEFKTRLANKSIVNGSNFIASFQPDKKRRVLLCAHWDSRFTADMESDKSKHSLPIDGANDGASGVGVLMELARVLSKEKCNIGVDIILFDVEDSGDYGDNNSWCLGSQYWAKNRHIPNYKAQYGILLDMVGASNPVFAHEMHSRMYAPDILNKVWTIAKELGYSNYFINKDLGGVMDDHVPINQYTGIPTIDIVHYDDVSETGFFSHWHTLNDNLDKIDKATLKMVGQTVLAVIYEGVYDKLHK